MVNIKQSLSSLWPSARISLALSMMVVSILLLTELLGLLPSKLQYELDYRKQISESMALVFSELASESDISSVRRVVANIVEREESVLTAGFRIQRGDLVFQVGPHQQQWGDYSDETSTPTHVKVPIYRSGQLLGNVEIRYRSMPSGVSSSGFIFLILFVALFCFVFFLIFILRTLRQIDPSSVVPERVNAAFDTLEEGVVILDDQQRIVLVNTAFSELLDKPVSALMGRRLDELGWLRSGDGDVDMPWVLAFAENENRIGDKMHLDVGDGKKHTMVVNSALIRDSGGSLQGMLLTFDDVTELEHQKTKLQEMVFDLESSRKEIQRQNKELFYLATRDPLTGSYNRRYFFEQFEILFSDARENDQELCCIMVDIDHFKQVNDNFGHDVGDKVICFLADVLQSCVRDKDTVGRYGGEEFCILMPDADIEEARAAAEKIRLVVQKDSGGPFNDRHHVTASLGVARLSDGAESPEQLNKQADQALYAAKESGRNRVVSWSEKVSQTQSEEKTVQLQEARKPDVRIPLSDHAHESSEIKSLQQQVMQLEKIAANFAEQLQKEKHYDAVTGLPNHTLFYDRIRQSMERADRDGESVAILIIGFDFFEQIKATRGAEAADKLFQAISKMLVGIFRRSDSVTVFNAANEDDYAVSRIERDEFGILVTDFHDAGTVPWVIKRIFSAFEKPVLLDEFETQVSFQVGVSIYPQDSSTPEELLTHAIVAKSNAKPDVFGSAYQFYDRELQSRAIEQMHIEEQIRASVANEDWVLFYQPKIDVKSGEVSGVEALIRWNHPEKGLLSPADFIEVAEQRGMIIEIGEWVLREACRQIKEWSDQALDIKISVNLSALQLRMDNLSNLILKIVDEVGISTSQLELELTETVLIDNFDRAINSLSRLHFSGIKITMDDFGTGYSSLSYLRSLPIDAIKIDRSFVANMNGDDGDANIVRTVIAMAHSMNLSVVAEGVEDQQQYDLLRKLQCDEVQGYFLARPLDKEQLLQWLNEKRSLASKA